MQVWHVGFRVSDSGPSAGSPGVGFRLYKGDFFDAGS